MQKLQKGRCCDARPRPPLFLGQRLERTCESERMGGASDDGAGGGGDGAWACAVCLGGLEEVARVRVCASCGNSLCAACSGAVSSCPTCRGPARFVPNRAMDELQEELAARARASERRAREAREARRAREEQESRARRAEAAASDRARAHRQAVEQARALAERAKRAERTQARLQRAQEDLARTLARAGGAPAAVAAARAAGATRCDGRPARALRRAIRQPPRRGWAVALAAAVAVAVACLFASAGAACALVWAGNGYVRAGHYEVAARLATAAMWLDPSFPGGPTLRATARQALGDVRGALADAEAAVALAPGSKRARAARGMLRVDAGQHEAALPDMEAAQEMAAEMAAQGAGGPVAATVDYFHSLALAGVGRVEEALPLARSAAARAPPALWPRYDSYLQRLEARAAAGARQGPGSDAAEAAGQ